MGWILRDGKVLASVDVADSFGSRLRGLIGRDGSDAALLLRPARSVHTIGMRYPIDVAHLDRELRVVRICTMRPWRVGMPVPRAHSVLEARAGAFAAWDLHVGDKLELRE